MDNPNHTLFLLLNASAEPSAPAVLVATVCAKSLVALVPLHLALVWVGGARPARFVALAAGVALVLAFAASGLLGVLFDTPRPFAIGLGHTLLEHKASASFPSNHALGCFTYAAVLALYGRTGLAAAVGLVGVAVAWSRVYLGVHFPLDMVGAAILAGLAAAAAAHAMTAWGERLLALAERLQGRLLSLLPRPRRAA